MKHHKRHNIDKVHQSEEEFNISFNNLKDEIRRKQKNARN
jgi:hypothetical protein